jgi:RNA-directed DNA polymerase
MNLALNGMARPLRDAFPKSQGGIRMKVPVMQFADDCIITGPSQTFLANEVQPRVEQFLAERGLTRSPEQTRITPMEDGFAVVGTHGRKYRGQL